MKKALLYSLLALFFFSSCNKDQKKPAAPANKTYQINLSVTGFTQQIVSSPTNKLQINAVKADALTDIGGYLDELYYYVFNASGQVVHTLKQDSTASNFGNIVDELPSGTYTVVIAAGKSRLTTNPTSTISVANNYFLYYSNAGATEWSDTFYDKFQLTVSGNNVTQNVTLNRIVAQLEVQLQDAIPATADSLLISVNAEDFEFILPNETIYNSKALTFRRAIPASAIGTSNFTLDNIVFNTYTPFTVTITCTDASQKILGTAIISNVTCQKNTKTILSGKLFGSNNGVTVGLSPWNPPLTLPFSIARGTNPTN